VLDVLIDVPGILEGIDKMQLIKDPKLQEAARSALIERYRDIDARLIQFNEEYGNASLQYTPTTEIPEKVTAAELSAAHIMTIFWTTCIIAHSLVGRPLRLEEPLKGQMDLPETVRNIVHAVPLFCHPTTGVFRIQIATPPIGAVMLILASMPPDAMPKERKLMEGLLALPQCAGIRRFLAGFLIGWKL
jgi:hypothetical protein